MSLSYAQFTEILNDFSRQAFEAFYNNKAEKFLVSHSIRYAAADDYFPSLRVDARVLVIGDVSTSKSDLLKAAKQIGFDSDRLEFRIGYYELRESDVRKLRYSNAYSDVILGPLPHSIALKGDYSSLAARMEQEEGYPNVVRATANRGLKISKSSFAEALRKTKMYEHLCVDTADGSISLRT